MPKSAIRNNLLQQRRQLASAEVRRRSFAVEQQLWRLPVFQSASRLALYSPVQNEVATLQLLRDALAARRQVAMPRVSGENLQFALIQSPEDLLPGTFGVLEPTSGCELVAVESLELVVVPGVGFDRQGHRLGYGKGYYDRALGKAGASVHRVGLAFDFQLVERLPVFDHDMRLHYLITESEVLQFTPDH